VAVTVTEQAQAVVGVPVMEPEEEMDRPAGRPVADQVRVAPDWESEPLSCNAVMAAPETFAWVPGLVTDTVLVMFQVNEVLSLSASESVAVTVTEQAQAVVGVPLTTPAEEIESPAGSPVAVKVTELPPVVSWGAVMVRLVIAEPDTLDWVPGLVTERLSTFQVRVTDPELPVVLLPPPAAPVP
jgi:hypothetical protein